jgi:hypothetical protein
MEMNTKLEVYFPIDSVVSSLAIVEDGTTRARVKGSVAILRIDDHSGISTLCL